MKRAYYSAAIKDFLNTPLNDIMGELLLNDEFATTDLQKNAWCEEIIILKDQLKDYPDGEIALEYTVPRLGSRIDAVCIISNWIYIMEFKIGDDKYRESTDIQVMDYALDNKNGSNLNEEVITLVNKNMDGISFINIDNDNDYIYISITKKISGIISDKVIVSEAVSKYKGYIKEDKKIIERV